MSPGSSSSWPPPPTGAPPPDSSWATDVDAADRARRKRLGWLLVVAGTVVVGVAGMMAWRTLVGDVERFTAPGQVTIDCRAGDDWRIGPATADRPADGGISVSVTTGAGQPVSTSPMTHTETVTVGSTSYTAAVTFECPTDGPTVVAITAAEGSTFAVFPSFRRTAIGLLPALPVGLAGLALVTAGVVLIVTRPKRRTG